MSPSIQAIYMKILLKNITVLQLRQLCLVKDVKTRLSTLITYLFAYLRCISHTNFKTFNYRASRFDVLLIYHHTYHFASTYQMHSYLNNRFWSRSNSDKFYLHLSSSHFGLLFVCSGVSGLARSDTVAKISRMNWNARSRMTTECVETARRRGHEPLMSFSTIHF